MKPGFASAAIGRTILGLALGLVIGQQAFAQPAPLPPGTTSGIPVPTIVTGTPPFGDTLLRELQSPVFSTNGPNTISGTVTSAAFLSSSGFLDFVYQFSFDSSTNIVISAVSVSSFANVAGVAVAQTSEDVDGSGLPAQNLGGTFQNNFAPASGTGSFSSASRPNANGDAINATLLTGVTGNQTSFAFIVRTQASGFSLLGSASVQGGGISAFTLSQGAIAPVGTITAPEPGALTLFALGIVMCGAGIIRRPGKIRRQTRPVPCWLVACVDWTLGRDAGSSY